MWHLPFKPCPGYVWPVYGVFTFVRAIVKAIKFICKHISKKKTYRLFPVTCDCILFKCYCIWH